MALDYTVKYASKIANRFKLASKTNRAAGHEYEFTGAKSVKIYSMVPAELTDYQRGGKRYGDVTDLEYTTQEMLCTQAKAFTKHLEALDGSDIAVETAAGKFLRMEIDERVVPMMDKYRLKKWVMGAATLKQMTAPPTKSTIVGDIMDLKGKMGDNLVPDTGLTLYISTTYFVLLKQADAIGRQGRQRRHVRRHERRSRPVELASQRRVLHEQGEGHFRRPRETHAVRRHQEERRFQRPRGAGPRLLRCIRHRQQERRHRRCGRKVRRAGCALDQRDQPRREHRCRVRRDVPLHAGRH